MFGFLVDFHLRVIGTEVAFAASLRLARLRLGEAVPCMACAAASCASIRIDPADAGIGPSRRVEFSAGQNFDGRTMTLEAADCDCRRTTKHGAEEIIERSKNLTGLSVVITFLLVYFLLVATTAILR